MTRFFSSYFRKTHHNMASSNNMDVYNNKTTLLDLVGMVATQEAPDF